MYIGWDIGIKNLAYCIIQNIDEQKLKYKILDWNILDISVTTKVKKIHKIIENVIKTFNSNKHFLEVDIVLIENQPCMKNPIMKSIQIF